MSDLSRQLRDEASYATCAESVNADVLREAADALEAAEAKLAVIDELHYRVIHRPSQRAICRYCREFWPCTTHRILHPEEEQ